MPNPSRAPGVSFPVEADALAALARLARKGACAVPAGAGEGYAILLPGSDPAKPPLVVSQAAMQYARGRGWLECEGERLRLSAAGAKILRGEATGGRAHRKPAAARPPATAAPGAAPERPLAWLRRRRDRDGRPLISEAQFAAGERLGHDYWCARMLPRVTADWSGIATSRRTRRATPGAGVEIGDGVLAARQRVERALGAVGAELCGILLDVCCHDVGLEQAGRAQGWPDRAAKIVLQLALTRLARHYGLIAPEPPVRARLRHWGDEGYRPNTDAWR